jgi:hypothetical protein
MWAVQRWDNDGTILHPIGETDSIAFAQLACELSRLGHFSLY